MTASGQNVSKENPMKEIRITKVVLSMGMGRNLQNLDKAEILARRLTGMTPVKTVSTRKAKTFKVSRGRAIGIKVTLRGKNKLDFLKRMLLAKERTLKKSNFDDEGNFSFGVKEYLDIPGEKYDPKIGVIGFNVNTTLERPGYRIKLRKIQKRKIPRNHRITKEESMEFAKNLLGIKIQNK